MKARAEAIRTIARELIASGRVDGVLGYRAGTAIVRAQPFVARTVEDAEHLTWNGFCGGNLATFAPRLVGLWAGKDAMQGGLAVTAQGCVSRNLVGLMQERQLERGRIHVIGVPCLGMLEPRRVEAKLLGRHLLGVDEEGDNVILHGRHKGRGFEETFLRRDLLRDNCHTCRHRNPVIMDSPAAEPVPDATAGNIDAVAAPWEKLDHKGRWDAFAANYKECIRCYACRDACPLCYCPTCFVDESDPQWCGKTQELPDVMTYHILRAFHCAGRCTDCGACETACPQALKVRRLTSKLEKDVRNLWGVEPGMEITASQPLMTFLPGDPQNHFK